MWPNATPPTGWFICNGNTFNTTTYPQLNTVLGGNTLPNFQGRFPLGVGNSGIPTGTQHNLGSTGGHETVTLTLSQIPPHNHDVTINYRQGEIQALENIGLYYSDKGDYEKSLQHFQNALNISRKIKITAQKRHQGRANLRSIVLHLLN